ncbi:MAG: ABC transporter permease [Firmicutes bacterium]|nr:ABC transporter permease [Bacillota bacterium]
MYADCDYRSQRESDSLDNYHIYAYGVPESGAGAIRSDERVQRVFFVNTSDGTQCRIQLKSEYANQAKSFFIELMNSFGLWSDPHYEGWTLKQLYYTIGREQYLNTVRYVSAITPYIARPSSILLTMFFAVFLGAAVSLLQNEKYNRSLADYGALRAIGMTKLQIYFINLFQTLIIDLASLLPAGALSVGAARLIAALLKRAGVSFEYFSSAFYGPSLYLSVLLVFFELTAASLIGTLIVCRLAREIEIIDLINRRRELAVSWVEKSYDRFEKARSAAVYGLLRAIRCRRSVFISGIEVAVMLPLPVIMIYVLLSGKVERAASTPSYWLIFSVSAGLSLTAAVVAAVVAGYHVLGRKKEFAVLRAIGSSKRGIFRIVLPSCITDALVSACTGAVAAAAACNWFINSEAPIVLTHHAVGIPLGQFLRLALFFSASAAAFTIPTELAGMSVSLLRSMGSSISDNLREVE